MLISVFIYLFWLYESCMNILMRAILFFLVVFVMFGILTTVFVMPPPIVI